MLACNDTYQLIYLEILIETLKIFHWSTFSRIRIGYGEILRTSLYSALTRENTDQKISEYGHFSRSDNSQLPKKNRTYFKYEVYVTVETK